MKKDNVKRTRDLIAINTLKYLNNNSSSNAKDAMDLLLKLKNFYRVNFAIKKTDMTITLALAYFFENNQGYNTTIANLFYAIKQHNSNLITDRQKREGKN
jgi:hypothetical protein